MLETGTSIRFTSPEGQELEGEVTACNKRGSTCVVAVPDKGKITINLNRAQWATVDAAGDASPTPTPTPSPKKRKSRSAASPSVVPANSPPRTRSKRPRREATPPPSPSPESPAAEDLEAGEAGAEEGTEASEDSGFDSFRGNPALSAALRSLRACTEHPAAFLDPSAGLISSLRGAVKALYEHTGERRALKASGALPVLHTEGFDVEQIWMQMDLRTEAHLKRSRKLMKKLPPDVTLLASADEAAIDALLAEHDADGSSGSDAELGEGPTVDAALGGGSDTEGEPEDDDWPGEGEAEEGGSHEARGAGGGAPPRERSVVEDRWLDLDDMEAFLQDAERADAKAKGLAGSGSEDEGEDMEEGSDEEAAVLASVLESGHGSMQAASAASVRQEELQGADIMFEDFFGPRKPAGGRGGRAAVGAPAEADRPHRAGGLHGAGGETPSSGDEGRPSDAEPAGLEEGSSGSEGEAMQLGAAGGGMHSAAATTYQRQREKMARQIEQLERENMGEKAWQMKGEVAGRARPENSALAIDMDFERTVRPPPVPTDESTADLEGMIRARCAEGRFDDPLRIVPSTAPKASTALQLDDGKAAAGLGELYEADYVRAATGGVADDKADALRSAARGVFKDLCGTLDALSNFAFAPKPVVEDLQIKANVPAILMEEAAPVAVAAGSMQAPGEVYRPQAAGLAKADEELTREEKRARRQRKKAARTNKEAGVLADKRNKAKTREGEAEVFGRKSEAALRTKGAKHGKSAFSTSTAVFKQLEDEKHQKGQPAPSALAPGAERKAPSRGSHLKL